MAAVGGILSRLHSHWQDYGKMSSAELTYALAPITHHHLLSTMAMSTCSLLKCSLLSGCLTCILPLLWHYECPYCCHFALALKMGCTPIDASVTASETIWSFAAQHRQCTHHTTSKAVLNGRPITFLPLFWQFCLLAQNYCILIFKPSRFLVI